LAPECKDTQTRYDMVANILYEGGDELSKGIFKIDLIQPSSEQWFRIQDLFVDEIMAQMINLSESYIQIWKRRK
jgi:U4/U6.U5 tri-snRNP-associated protein 2